MHSHLEEAGSAAPTSRCLGDVWLQKVCQAPVQSILVGDIRQDVHSHICNDDRLSEVGWDDPVNRGLQFSCCEFINEEA